MSTTEIAGAAGVARGPVNHYFGTKRQLYLQVVQQATTVPPTAVGAGATDGDKLRALIRPYGQLARSAGREWLLKDTLTRAEVHRLLTATLTVIVRDVYPTVAPNSA